MPGNAGSSSGSSQDAWAVKKMGFFGGGGKVCILQMNETMSGQTFAIFPSSDPFYLDPSPSKDLFGWFNLIFNRYLIIPLKNIDNLLNF